MDGSIDGTEKTIPQVHAEKCPVCNGFGTLKYGEITCQGCDGKGYILVPNVWIERKGSDKHGDLQK